MPTQDEIESRRFYAQTPRRAPAIGDRVRIANPDARGKPLRGAVTKIEFEGFHVVVLWDGEDAYGYQANSLRLAK